MRRRLNPGHHRLPAALRPVPVTVELPAVNHIDKAERELVRHAQADDQRCWGYFPSLAGHPGIHTDLPACRDFATALPEITTAGACYQFNFIRLSLSGQSQPPAYHLDTDAATALTGDPATLNQRQVGRILLNLSTADERSLYYLDLDVSSTALTHEGAYVRAADQALAARHTVRAAIPPRSGTITHGISFVSSHVLHSGVNGAHGHFVTAYGYDLRRPPGRSAAAPRHVGRLETRLIGNEFLICGNQAAGR
jgi:hypothetical protein